MNNQYPNMFYVSGTQFSFPQTIFDLQVHSIYSDGTQTPENLLDQASQKNIEYLSITDHNSIKAYSEELLAQAKKLDIHLVPGTEIDCFGEFDVLVYDLQADTLSDAYTSKIQGVLQKVNQRRNILLQKTLDLLIEFLKNGQHPKWLNWNTFTESQKQQLLSDLTLSSLQHLSLNPKVKMTEARDFVSKIHLVTMLSRHELVNVPKFVSETHVTEKEAAKAVINSFFTQCVQWLPDSTPVDWELLHEVTQLPFMSIIAHPGKTFRILNPRGSEKEYREYISSSLQKGFSGLEADYRKYRTDSIQFNEIALKTAQNLSLTTGRKFYVTGGSDCHEKLI